MLNVFLLFIISHIAAVLFKLNWFVTKHAKNHILGKISDLYLFLFAVLIRFMSGMAAWAIPPTPHHCQGS